MATPMRRPRRSTTRERTKGTTPPPTPRTSTCVGRGSISSAIALGSCAAFIAGVAIRYGASPIVDPLASFLVVAILVAGALRLIKDAVLVLLDAAPPRLPVARVRKVVLAYPGVKGVHALHIWSLGTGSRCG